NVCTADIHPVTAVFPGIPNPTNYLALNASNTIGGNNDSDTLVSSHSSYPAVAAVIECIDNQAVLATTAADNALVLLSVPHLYWRASANVPNDVPLNFDCLLDNGSHLVLIM